MATQVMNGQVTATRGYEKLERVELRNLIRKLKAEEQERIDCVVSHDRIIARDDGTVFIADAPISDEHELPQLLTQLGIFFRTEGEDMSVDLDYELTRWAANQLVRRLNIPVKYSDLLREEQPALWAHNVNARLKHKGDNYLVRALAPRSQSGSGLIRAFLSDRYEPDNNIDLLLAVFAQLQKMGIAEDIEVGRCSVDARSMYVELNARNIKIDASDFLQYRNPETRQPARYIYAGLVLENSEVGAGSRIIRPRSWCDTCMNAFTFERDSRVFRTVHRGSKLEEGWVSAQTKEAYMKYVQSEFADAVARFLSPEYLDDLVNGRLRTLADQTLEHPKNAVASFTQRLGMSEEERDAVFNAFMKGGDDSALGALQAVTYVAQKGSPERQYELERLAGNAADQIKSLDREEVTA